MAISLAGISFGNATGLYGLLALLPLIILYLIRPRPKPMIIPSLMFFMRAHGYNKLTSFLKQITKDWLFLIQLITLLALCLILASPFTLYQHDITAQNTIIVIDASASSQVRENGKTRFDIAITRAKGLLGSKNTIILAKSMPTIIAKDANAPDALEALKLARAKDTGTRLGDAIILAGEALAGKEGRVVVLSDFINTEGQDPQTAKALLQGKGITVDFISTATDTEKSNVGFVDLRLGEKSSTAYIKNYDRMERAVRIEMGGKTSTLTLPAGAIEPFAFETPAGNSRLRLLNDDDFAVDNELYIATPDKPNITALLITSNASIFITRALQASEQVDLTIAELPIVPQGDFDVYIIADIKPEKVLAGTFEDIAEKVKDGASLVIQAQENQALMNYETLMDADVKGVGDAAQVTIQQVMRFTRNIDFGQVDHYPFITLDKSFTKLATAGPEETAVLAIAPFGHGKVVYFGILEQGSDFKFSTHYPIFWTELMRSLADKEDLGATNRRTGETLVLNKEARIVLPTKEKRTASTLLLEDQGIYQTGTRSIAANLLHETEGDLRANASVGQRSTEYQLQAVKEKREFSFEMPLLIIAAIMLLFEVLYVKLRGDV